MASELAGAWELIADEQEGLAVFTDAHYGIVSSDKGRRAPADPANPTTAEALALFASFFGNAGSYELVDGGVTTRPIAAKVAELVGSEIPVRCSVDGDELSWSVATSDGTRVDSRWRRVAGPGSAPIAGAWEMQGAQASGISIYADGRYFGMFRHSEEPSRSAPVAELTDEEIARRWEAMGNTVGGQYSFADGHIRQRFDIAKSPDWVGRPSKWTFDSDGDRATVRLVLPEGDDRPAMEIPYRRL